MSFVGVTSRDGLGVSCHRDVIVNDTYALPAMVMRPTADSGLESVLCVKTVETA